MKGRRGDEVDKGKRNEGNGQRRLRWGMNEDASTISIVFVFRLMPPFGVRFKPLTQHFASLFFELLAPCRSYP